MVNKNGKIEALTGLETEQAKLLCLMAYLGEVPGDYALKQLYGRNHAAAKRSLESLDRTRFTKNGRVAPRALKKVPKRKASDN